jgi:hypothetical protein
MEGIVFTRAAIYEKDNPPQGNGSKEPWSLIHHSPFFTQPSCQRVSELANHKATVAQRESLIEHIAGTHWTIFGPFHRSDKVWRNDENAATPWTSSPT